MKRGNDNAQMSREDVEALDDEDDEEPSSGGTFRRASNDVLAGRKIVKIKRKGSKQPEESSAPAATVSFSGFAPVPPKLDETIGKSAPEKAVVDGSDSERCKKIRKLNESFLKWAEKQMETHPLSIWKDGVKDYIKHYQTIEEKYGNNGAEPTLNGAPKAASATCFGGFPASASASAPAAAKPFAFGAPAVAAAPAPAAASKPPAASPFAGFSFAPAPVAAAPAVAPAVTAPKPFAFSAPATVAAPAPATAPVSAPAAAPATNNPFGNGFSFGATSTAAAVAPKPAATSFGAAPAPMPAFSATFSTGGFGAATVPSFGGFGSSSSGFGSSAGAAGGDEEGDGGDDEGEPILEPEKVLRNAADTDEILHEVPCKLYSYNTTDKEWKDTGKGSFRITRDATTKKQRMLVRNTIGRINFNAGFFAGMKVEQVQKKIKFAAFVAVEDTTMGSDGKAAPARTEMKTFMLQLKAEDVDATLKKMQAGVASVQK